MIALSWPVKKKDDADNPSQRLQGTLKCSHLAPLEHWRMQECKRLLPKRTGAHAKAYILIHRSTKVCRKSLHAQLQGRLAHKHSYILSPSGARRHKNIYIWLPPVTRAFKHTYVLRPMSASAVKMQGLRPRSAGAVKIYTYWCP